MLWLAFVALAVAHLISSHRAYHRELELRRRVARIETKPLIHAVLHLPDRKTADAVLPALRDYGVRELANWDAP